jgi:lipoprotein signal peptidase
LSSLAESAGAGRLKAAAPEYAQRTTRLRGNWLIAARAAWWLALAASLALLIAALPLYHEQLRTLAIIPDPAVRAKVFTSLNSLGLSGGFLADYSTAITIARAIVYFAIALIIYRGRSDDWMALFVSFALVVFTVGRLLDRMAGEMSFAAPAAIMTGLAFASFNVQFYLFPDGRFVPRWTRWVALVWSGMVVLAGLFPATPLDVSALPGPLWIVIQLGILGTLAFAQSYRYRRVSSPSQRQQTKWVVYGLAVSLTLTALVALAAGFVPRFDLLANPSPQAVLFELVGSAIIGVALTIIPLAIGFAVLRYRLWDIDLIINRTLVYVPLTAIVAGLYAASLTLSQRAFIAMTGQPSDLSLALAVLVLAGTFTPIKQRLQDLVDRHFRSQAEPTSSLRDLQRRVQAVAAILDRDELLRALLAEAVAGLDAQGGAVYEGSGEEARLVHSTGGWGQGVEQVRIAISSGGREIGALVLGSARSGRPYAEEEVRQVELVAADVGRTVQLIGGLRDLHPVHEQPQAPHHPGGDSDGIP